MRQDAEWGGQQELYAAAQSLSVDIYVHQVDAPRFIILCDYSSGAAANSLMAQRKSIHISFHGECHYNSIRLVTDDVYDLASVPIYLDAPANASTTTATATQSSSSSTNPPQNLIDTVAQSVPWVSMADIRIALEMAENDVEDTIEVLMANPQGFAAPSSNKMLLSNSTDEKVPQPKSQSIADLPIMPASDSLFEDNGKLKDDRIEDGKVGENVEYMHDNSNDIVKEKENTNTNENNSNSNGNNEEKTSVKDDEDISGGIINKIKVKKDRNTVISSHRVTINKTMSKKVLCIKT